MKQIAGITFVFFGFLSAHQTLRQDYLTEKRRIADDFIATLRALEGKGVNEYGADYCCDELAVIDSVCKKAGFPTPPVFEISPQMLAHNYAINCGIFLHDSVYVHWINWCDKPFFIVIDPFFKTMPEFLLSYLRTFMGIAFSIGQYEAIHPIPAADGILWGGCTLAEIFLGYKALCVYDDVKKCIAWQIGMVASAALCYGITKLFRKYRWQKCIARGKVWGTN